MSNFRRMSLYSFINWNGALLPGNRFGTANILFVIVVATLPPYPNSRIWILWPKQGQGFKHSTANLTQILFQYHRPPMFRQPLLSFQLNQIKSIFWATVITFFASRTLSFFLSWFGTPFLAFLCLAFTFLDFNKHSFTYITTELWGRIITHPGSRLIALTTGHTAGAPRTPSSPTTVQGNWNQNISVQWICCGLILSLA